MADLPSIADRINDIEVAANAPVTETVVRRVGSDINYILDFLGINDGDPLPGGGASLSNFFTAITTIAGHTIDLQASVPFTGGLTTGSIGTFTMTPFLNQVIYLRMSKALSFGLHGFSAVVGSVPDFTLNFNVDAGGATALKAPQFGTRSTDGLGAEIGIDPYPSGNSHVTNSSPTGVNRTGTHARNPGLYTGGALDPEEWFIEVAELDWRDGSSIQLDYSVGAFFGPATFYRGYRLNAESLIF